MAFDIEVFFRSIKKMIKKNCCKCKKFLVFIWVYSALAMPGGTASKIYEYTLNVL